MYVSLHPNTGQMIMTNRKQACTSSHCTKGQTILPITRERRERESVVTYTCITNMYPCNNKLTVQLHQTAALAVQIFPVLPDAHFSVQPH